MQSTSVLPHPVEKLLELICCQFVQGNAAQFWTDVEPNKILIASLGVWSDGGFTAGLILEQFPEIMRKRKRGQGAQGKAEDAGGLTPVKDGNAALRFLDR